MIILCSDGLSSEKIKKECRSLFSTLKTAALVVTADNEYKAANYHVKRCIQELEQMNLSVDVFDLDIHDPTLLLRYDVVEFIGGNPFYLLQAIRNSHAETILKKIVEQNILIGWSAAVFVFGPTLELVNRYTPEMNFQGIENLDGLKLTDVEVLPHYSKFLKRFEGFEATCEQYEEEFQTEVLRLDDGEAVFIDHKIINIVKND